MSASRFFTDGHRLDEEHRGTIAGQSPKRRTRTRGRASSSRRDRTIAPKEERDSRRTPSREWKTHATRPSCGGPSDSAIEITCDMRPPFALAEREAHLAAIDVPFGNEEPEKPHEARVELPRDGRLERSTVMIRPQAPAGARAFEARAPSRATAGKSPCRDIARSCLRGLRHCRCGSCDASGSLSRAGHRRTAREIVERRPRRRRRRCRGEVAFAVTCSSRLIAIHPVAAGMRRGPTMKPPGPSSRASTSDTRRVLGSEPKKLAAARDPNALSGSSVRTSRTSFARACRITCETRTPFVFQRRGLNAGTRIPRSSSRDVLTFFFTNESTRLPLATRSTTPRARRGASSGRA